jgi:hypothetical protein
LTRYLTYEPWIGELNNTRMCFETALVIAFLSQRCLVLPAWYRRPGEPESDGRKFRPLHPGEFLDLAVLEGAVHCIEESAYEALDVPVELEFSPETAVFCYPSIPPPESPEYERLRAFAGPQRRYLQFTPKMHRCRTLHIRNPMLEQFYAFFYFLSLENELSAKRLIQERVRFRPEILQTAERISSTLGDYSAMHVRRNDFFRLYPEQNLSPEQLLRSLTRRVRDGELLYIATDEPDRTFFAPLRQRYDVRFADPIDLPAASAACVEQLVCARAQRFLGTRFSTFSAYIVRLRGYLGAVDRNTYFTDGSPGSEIDSIGAPPFSWTNWMASGGPLWGREFREGWEI